MGREKKRKPSDVWFSGMIWISAQLENQTELSAFGPFSVIKKGVKWLQS